MGTQATAVINLVDTRNGKKDPYVRLSKDCDGFPEFFGLKIHNILASKEMVRGIPFDADKHSITTSANDMAAQLVSELKQEYPVGTICLLPATHNYLYEYNYYINFVGHKLDSGFYTDKLHSIIVRKDTGETIFSTENSNPSKMWEEFYEFCVG